MCRQIILSFVDSRRAISTCCAHLEHATVADLIRCAGERAFFAQPQGVKFDIVTCQGQPIEDFEFFNDVELSEPPTFPCYFVQICTRKAELSAENAKSNVTTPDMRAKDAANKDDVVTKTRLSLRDVPELPFSDVTIFVGKESVRSNSGYLAVNSAYFGRTFATMICSKQQMSVTLSGVTSSELAAFLLAIYPKPTNIDGSNVVRLAKLAHRFVAQSLVDRCVTFLKSDRMPLWERIYIARKLDKLPAFSGLSEELQRQMLPVVRKLSSEIDETSSECSLS